MTLRFSLSEVKQTKDESGKAVIEIPIETIMAKLPKAQRVKAEYSFRTKEDVDAEHFDKLNGTYWKNFAALNCESPKCGYRSIRAYAKFLEGISVVTEKYGVLIVNDAISGISDPDKANIPYLKKVCLNISQSSERKGKADAGTIKHDADKRNNNQAAFNKKFGAKMPAMRNTVKADHISWKNQASLCL